MKNKLFKILTCVVLALFSVVGLVACDDAEWDNSRVTLKEITAPMGERGGVFCETQNYIYFINGIGDNEADNTLGTPIKGALYAIEKSALASGDVTKQSIIVPKLFVSTDYSAGVYIYGDYVYYGTPLTEKNANGEIANDQMVITRTKLDGTGTENLVKVGKLSTEFRVSEKEGVVYITYYDSSESALKSFNVYSGETTVIAKTDDKTDKESLKSYKFLDNASLESAVVVYTTTEYAVPYNEEDAKNENYQRLTKSYNAVYAYKAGDGVSSEGANTYGKKVLDGNKTIAENYAFSKVLDNRLLYTVTKNDNSGVSSTLIVDVDRLCAGEVGDKITNETYLSAAVGDCIVNLSTAYYVDDTSKNIMKTTLIGSLQEINEETVAVAKGSAVSSFLFVEADYLYYIDTSNKIQRIYVGTSTDEALKNVQRVSAGEITKSFYAPKLTTVGGQSYLFYVDASKYGCSYVAYANLGSQVIEEDTDEDGTNDLYYLEKTTIIGEMADQDKAKIVEEKITAIADSCDSSGKIQFDEGTLEVKAISDARAELEKYNNSAIRDLISEDKINTLIKYEKAFAISVKLNPLKDFQGKTVAEKDELKDEFAEIKAFMDAVLQGDTSENHTYYEAIMDLVAKDLNYQYGKAKTYFANK